MEAYYGFQLLTHGEAVAYGIWFASLLSLQMGLGSKSVVAFQLDLLKGLVYFVRCPHSTKISFIKKCYWIRNPKKAESNLY